MQITTLKSKFLGGSFDQNTYVLSEGNEAVVVDAGAEVEDVLAVVGNKKVLAIMFTHLHFDHTWNIQKYLEKFDCDVYVKKGAEDILTSAEKNASTIIGQNITHKIPRSKIKYYAEKLKVGLFEFDVIETPGHSLDSVCLLCNRNLFCGDNLFFDGVGRTDLFGGSEKDLESSLKKLRDIDFDRAYSGHFDSFSKAHADRTILMFVR
jgi:glyoxylase-like metal-dependent hydrolase (beta-lactamase superfamily II)